MPATRKTTKYSRKRSSPLGRRSAGLRLLVGTLVGRLVGARRRPARRGSSWPARASARSDLAGARARPRAGSGAGRRCSRRSWTAGRRWSRRRRARPPRRRRASRSPGRRRWRPGMPVVLAELTASGPVRWISSSVTSCSGIRTATVPRVSPRSHCSELCWVHTRVSGSGPEPVDEHPRPLRHAGGQRVERGRPRRPAPAAASRGRGPWRRGAGSRRRGRRRRSRSRRPCRWAHHQLAAPDRQGGGGEAVLAGGRRRWCQ